jgi:hypothetical protein
VVTKGRRTSPASGVSLSGPPAGPGRNLPDDKVPDDRDEDRCGDQTLARQSWSAPLGLEAGEHPHERRCRPNGNAAARRCRLARIVWDRATPPRRQAAHEPRWVCLRTAVGLQRVGEGLSELLGGAVARSGVLCEGSRQDRIDLAGQRRPAVAYGRRRIALMRP